MKNIAYPSLLILTLTLSACGGGGGTDAGTSAAAQTQTSGSTPTTGTSTTAPSNVTQVVEYYGDSTIWGFASGSNGVRVAKPAPQTFAEQLPAAAKYDVRNEGVNRTTACQLLNGTDGTHPAWDIQMANSNAKFVIINHAINDTRPDIGESVPAYKNCLAALARKAKQSGKKVIFETPNPTTDNGLEAYVTGMKEVAAQEQVPVMDQYKYLIAYLNGQSVTTICPDGLHPKDDVYAMKGRYAAGEFLKMSF